MATKSPATHGVEEEARQFSLYVCNSPHGARKMASFTPEQRELVIAMVQAAYEFGAQRAFLNQVKDKPQ